MDFYFNTNMDSTYAKKYSTLVCFHLIYKIGGIKMNAHKHNLGVLKYIGWYVKSCKMLEMWTYV
jgi:hypothetical protein